MKRGCVIGVILAAIGIIALCALVAQGTGQLIGAVVNTTQAMGDTANAFMVAVRDGKLDEAYTLLATEERESVSLGNFREDFSSDTITDWQFTSFQMTNNVGSVSGQATVNGRSVGVSFNLVNRDNRWWITGYNVGE